MAAPEIGSRISVCVFPLFQCLSNFRQGEALKVAELPVIAEFESAPADRVGPYCALSVVAPCYNEAAGLTELHRRVSAVCRRTVGDSYELVLINDGSSDGTLAVMAVLADSDPHVVAINLTRNYGHQVALTAGLEHCRGDRVLIIDADLQDPPE